MANTIARARGYDKSRIKEVHRLGSVAAFTEAATWRTFVRVHLNADGSASINAERDGRTLHTHHIAPE